MNARSKLNYAHLTGSLITAGVVGLVTQSWPVFVVALAVLIIGNVISGGIRPRGRHG